MYPMLTKRDHLRGEAFNKILAACKVEPLTRSVLSQRLTKWSVETMGNYCEALFNEGYLSSEVKEFGKYRRMCIFYTTVIDHYSMEDMIPSTIKIQAGMKANGTTNKKKGASQAEDEKKPLHIRTISFESNSEKSIALRDKFKQQSELNRKERKSPKNYVSGSILSAAV